MYIYCIYSVFESFIECLAPNVNFAHHITGLFCTTFALTQPKVVLTAGPTKECVQSFRCHQRTMHALQALHPLPLGGSTVDPENHPHLMGSTSPSSMVIWSLQSCSTSQWANIEVTVFALSDFEGAGFTLHLVHYGFAVIKKVARSCQHNC